VINFVFLNNLFLIFDLFRDPLVLAACVSASLVLVNSPFAPEVSPHGSKISANCYGRPEPLLRLSQGFFGYRLGLSILELSTARLFDFETRLLVPCLLEPLRVSLPKDSVEVGDTSPLIFSVP
jgi:hypothetical protein